MKFPKVKIISYIWEYGAFTLLIGIIFFQRYVVITDVVLLVSIIFILLFTFLGEYIITPYFLVRKDVFVGEIVIPFGRKIQKILIDAPIESWEVITDIIKQKGK